MVVVEMSPGGSVAIGVVVGVVSTCIQSVGLTLQRKSHLLEEEKEEEWVRRPPYRRRRWQIGMFMFLAANIIGSTIQITTLPLPVLSTLQASGLVFNTACATIILKEPFTRYSVIGTVLVASGAVLIAIFGALAEPSHNLDQLLLLFGRSQFLAWLFGTLAVVIIMIASMWFLGRLHPRPSPRVRLIKGMSFGAISGVLSAHCLLLAKSAVELLVRTVADGSNQFNRWQSWMILVFFVFLALSQLYYLHRGLKLCSTSVLYPFVFCIYNIVAIMDGLIYFHQTGRLSVLHACLIALGTAVLLAGVFALSWRLSDELRQGPQEASTADPQAMAQSVPPPQSALAPGLGLVDVNIAVGDESPVLHPTDAEDSLEDLRHLPPSESTPLLHSATSPLLQRAGGKYKRPPRRHFTLQEQRSEIWDELNDRREASVQFETSPHSPYSLRSPVSSRVMGRATDRDRGARRRTETLPSRRHSAHAAHPIRKFSWLVPGMRTRSNTAVPPLDVDPQPPQPTSSQASEDGYDEEADAGYGSSVQQPANSNERPSIWSLGGRRRKSEGATAVGGWFKLKWWNRRWKHLGEPRTPLASSADADASFREEDRHGYGTND